MHGLLLDHFQLQDAVVCYPENPTGPDVILPENSYRQTWPHRQDVPMSFAHPVLAEVFRVEPFAGLKGKQGSA